MAALNPSFISGASARIKVGGKTLAYATDLSINVTMDTIPIESIGKYEVHSNEPNLYSVDGSFRIIRYSKRASEAPIANAASAAGNDPLYIGTASSTGASPGSVKAHLEPGRILGSTGFELELYDQRQVADTVGLPAAGAISEVQVYWLQNCRIVSRTGSLDRRGVLTETYNFVGLLHQDKDAAATATPDNPNQTDAS